MKECVIGENTVVEKSIIADKTIVGANCHLGVGEYAPSTLNEKYMHLIWLLSEKIL